MPWETAKDAARRLTPELAQADIVVGNDDEFAILCNGDKDGGRFWLRAILRGQDNWCCTKWGSKAAEPFAENAKLKTSIFPVTLSKPFGAGDAFLGNLLARLGRDADTREGCERGAVLSLLLLSPVQAVPLLPVQQLNRFHSPKSDAAV